MKMSSHWTIISISSCRKVEGEKEREEGELQNNNFQYKHVVKKLLLQFNKRNSCLLHVSVEVFAALFCWMWASEGTHTHSLTQTLWVWCICSTTHRASLIPPLFFLIVRKTLSLRAICMLSAEWWVFLYLQHVSWLLDSGQVNVLSSPKRQRWGKQKETVGGDAKEGGR